jgi:hypothetical protein
MTTGTRKLEFGEALADISAQWSSAVRPYKRTVSGRGRSLLNDVTRTLGVSKQLTEPSWEQWRRVLRNSTAELAALGPPKGPRILLASAALPWDEIKLVVESTLAMALRLRGADVSVLVCNKTLPACEVTPWGNGSPEPGPGAPKRAGFARTESCRSCTHQLERLFADLPVRRVRLSEFAAPVRVAAAERQVAALAPEEFRSYRYKGVNVGEYAFSSMLRATLRGTLEDDELTRTMYRRYLFSISYYVDVLERFFPAEAPDRVLVCDGVYAMMGTLCQFAATQGVPAVTWGIPLRKQTLWLERGDSVHRKLLGEPPEVWDGFDFTVSQERLIDEYLSEKRLGGKDYLAYHAESVEDHVAIRRELDIDDSRPIVSLFTNVLWDAQIFYNGTAFSGMLDWLDETISWFAAHPDRVLAIRIHPAESRGSTPTRQPIADEIAKRHPRLAPNIKLILPDNRISSYALAEMSTSALIYGARMGWEVAALGTPLVIAGEAFSRGKGFSTDASSREEYFRILETAHQLPRNDEAVRRRAKKYGYHFLYRRMLDLPVMGPWLAKPELNFESLSELMPGRCPQLDLICDSIMDGSGDFVWTG